VPRFQINVKSYLGSATLVTASGDIQVGATLSIDMGDQRQSPSWGGELSGSVDWRSLVSENPLTLVLPSGGRGQVIITSIPNARSTTVEVRGQGTPPKISQAEKEG
jgi:ABC-type antimicrobial peptide transport system permease subunit